MYRLSLDLILDSVTVQLHVCMLLNPMDRYGRTHSHNFILVISYLMHTLYVHISICA